MRQPIEPARRGFAVPVATTLAAAALVAGYFHAELAAFVTGDPPIESSEKKIWLTGQDLRKPDVPVPALQAAAAESGFRIAAQVQQTAPSSASQPRLPDESEARSEALARELAETRRIVDGLTLQLATEAAKTAQLLEQVREKASTIMRDEGAARQALMASAEQSRQKLEGERARATGLESELAAALSAVDEQIALSRKADDKAAQDKRDAESAIEDLQKSLQQERDKAVALAQEGKATREALTASAEQHRRELDESRARAAALASELAAARSEIESKSALSKAEEAAQQRQDAESTIAELRKSLQEERERIAALVQEAGAARDALTAGVEQDRRALEEERARAAALENELAAARREIETKAALVRKADEAEQYRQDAESTIAELRKSLQQEREKIAALAQEAGAARQALTAGAEQSSQTLEEGRAREAKLASELAAMRGEIERQAALLRKANDEAAQHRQEAKSTIANLRKTLQQERAKTEAMARDVAPTRRAKDRLATVGRAVDSQMVTVGGATEIPVTEQPAAREAQDRSEAARLVARAGALIGQGNIGAARIVLERAAEAGDPQASFMLAQTYDPAVLSAWGTYGTRGEASKARELYAKAHAGGVREAKERLDALRQSEAPAKR
jgi:chromosome segregation ATPase